MQPPSGLDAGPEAAPPLDHEHAQPTTAADAEAQEELFAALDAEAEEEHEEPAEQKD